MAEKSLLLQLLDQTWKDHLLSLDHLRQGINLRAYAQRDPLNEYKREAFELFEGMLVNLREQVTSVLSHIELRVPQPAFAGAIGEPEEAMAEEMRATGTTGRAAPARGRAPRRGNMGNGGGGGAGNGAGSWAEGSETLRTAAAPPRAPWSGTPRNAPCPCGSGRKFKHCHGRV